MNALWPILVIAIAAVVWWLLVETQAPRPFRIALIAVVAILLIVWLFGVVSGGGLVLAPPWAQ
jgi:hypothetical protein